MTCLITVLMYHYCSDDIQHEAEIPAHECIAAISDTRATLEFDLGAAHFKMRCQHEFTAV